MYKRSKSFISFTFSLLIFCLLFTINASSSETFPSPTNYKYINDYTNTIDKSTIKKIISIGKELEDKTSAQAIIVVIDSTNGTPIEDYANKLFRAWGIGEKNKDNGFLILLALDDKAWKVEVGRGLEGAVPDVLTNRVMQEIAKPNFINGDYSEGLLNSYSVFSDYIASEYGVTLDKSLNVTLPNESNLNGRKEGKLAIGLLLLLIFADIFLNRGRISSSILHLLFWNSFFNGNGRGGPGGFGGGSSGGDFGGYGGGSSNGGGSSGNW
ncbi:TPM domain-containing protein [Clostridium saudiense]|nr:TPM domain-containing protein [Clostridium saudiense]